jgi:hypothetical protein
MHKFFFSRHGAQKYKKQCVYLPYVEKYKLFAQLPIKDIWLKGCRMCRGSAANGGTAAKRSPQKPEQLLLIVYCRKPQNLWQILSSVL